MVANNAGASSSVTVAGSLNANGSITIADGKNIITGTTTGTKIGTATTQKLGFFNATPVVQPNATLVTLGYTSGTGTTVTIDGKFTGNTGTTAYTIADIIAALKNLGLLTS